MNEYWESRFKEEGAMWKFDPSDSAIFALDFFRANKISAILIPGFGYGRNAKLFYDHGLNVTGIEISESAITLAKNNAINCKVHHGSVTDMPFDNDFYDGIFCYALLHLLNQSERRNFLKSCFRQLRTGGFMIFVVASKQMSMYGDGKFISKDRFEISDGLKVYFYESASIQNEFANFGLIKFADMEEPIKFEKGHDPMKLILVICKKSENY